MRPLSMLSFRSRQRLLRNLAEQARQTPYPGRQDDSDESNHMSGRPLTHDSDSSDVEMPNSNVSSSSSEFVSGAEADSSSEKTREVSNEIEFDFDYCDYDFEAEHIHDELEVLREEYVKKIAGIKEMNKDFSAVEIKCMIACLELGMNEKQADFPLRLVSSENFAPVRCMKTLMDKLAQLSFASERYLLCMNTDNQGRSIPTDNCPGRLIPYQKIFRCDQCERTESKLEPYIFFDIISQIQIISSCVSIDARPQLNEPLEIELHVTCDGIPLSKSSNLPLYPVILYINNFNNVLKQSKHYILASVFIQRHHQKVDYPTLFHSLIEQVKQQSYFATRWAPKCLVKIVSFLADAPCRAAVLNMLQYNGNFACHKCKIQYRTRIRLDDEGNDENKRYLPILRSTELIARELEEVIEIGNGIKELQARQTVEPIEGIKGPSVFNSIDFDFVQRTPMETMHCLFLGATRRMIYYFFENSRILSASQKRRINERRKAFRLPSKISRGLRSFDEMKNFKSAEWQNILFFFSYFLFKGILQDNLFELFIQLSQSSLRLFYASFGPEDVEEGRQLLDKFLLNLRRNKHHEQFEIFNFHALAHLYEDRLIHGPLFEVSAYSYENQLQLFKIQFHSKNKLAATIEKRVKCERMLSYQTVVDSNPIKFSREIDDVENKPDVSRYESHIRVLLHLGNDENISFYQFATLGHLNISIRKNDARSKYDCLIKQNGKFYFVDAIFVASGKHFALLEEIDVENEPITFTCKDKTTFAMPRHHKVTNSNTRNFDVTEIHLIQKHVAFVYFGDEQLINLFGCSHFILDL